VRLGGLGGHRHTRTLSAQATAARQDAAPAQNIIAVFTLCSLLWGEY
jgi:hypothetical protein